jgi:hypothetical protein
VPTNINNIKPAATLPGSAQLLSLANGVAFWALIGAVVALVVGAAMWAIGSNSQNIHQSMAGRRTVAAAILAAAIIGAAPHLVGWFFNLGQKVGG